jgi:protein trunk
MCSIWKFWVLVLGCVTFAQPRSIGDESDFNKVCGQLPPVVLSEILGSAFNSRYMSIDVPRQRGPSVIGANGKREVYDDEDFYVDADLSLDLSDTPAWEVQRFADESVMAYNKRMESTAAINRKPRASRLEPSQRIKTNHPKSCASQVRWIDLGADYYPQFMRTVECLSQGCWYGLSQCKPKAFSVRILRRRAGKCVKPGNLKRIGNAGLHDELKEMWVWEERAVTFCCECAHLD